MRTIPQLGPGCLALNPGVEATLNGPAVALPAEDEASLQRNVETALELMGYRRRAPKNIRNPVPPRGWFIHVHRAKGNPIVLDLLILHRSGRYLEMELKVKGGRVSDDQKGILAKGGRLAWSIQEAVDIVKQWEAENRLT